MMMTEVIRSQVDQSPCVFGEVAIGGKGVGSSPDIVADAKINAPPIVVGGYSCLKEEKVPNVVFRIQHDEIQRIMKGGKKVDSVLSVGR